MKLVPRSLPSPAMVLSIVALFIAIGGSAYAVKNASVRSKDIANGAVRGKDIATNTVKGKNVRETSLSIPCPAGATKVVGVCFEAAPSAAPTTWKAAVDACNTKNGYLPGLAQLRSAVEELANVGQGTEGEWTDSAYEENGNLKAIVVGSAGGFQYRQQDALRPYRCVMPLL